ncbi:hypothetical protein EDD99_5593 [Streptomyces sp. 846.5]|nr:hypothetical protein [Streptomyces sp. 846.5]TDT97455.1 hypothetical protein EDD99_5593 [Streptomyces sp. 846.5]
MRAVPAWTVHTPHDHALPRALGLVCAVTAPPGTKRIVEARAGQG